MKRASLSLTALSVRARRENARLPRQGISISRARRSACDGRSSRSFVRRARWRGRRAFREGHRKETAPRGAGREKRETGLSDTEDVLLNISKRSDPLFTRRVAQIDRIWALYLYTTSSTSSNNEKRSKFSFINVDFPRGKNFSGS